MIGTILFSIILAIFLINCIEWLAVGIRNYTYVEWVKELFNRDYLKMIKYIVSRLW